MRGYFDFSDEFLHLILGSHWTNGGLEPIKNVFEIHCSLRVSLGIKVFDGQLFQFVEVDWRLLLAHQKVISMLRES